MFSVFVIHRLFSLARESLYGPPLTKEAFSVSVIKLMSIPIEPARPPYVVSFLANSVRFALLLNTTLSLLRQGWLGENGPPGVGLRVQSYGFIAKVPNASVFFLC